MTTPKYYNETVCVSKFVHEGRFTDVKLSVSASLNFMIFPKISGLCQELAHAQNQLEKLGEVYTINFLTIDVGLKITNKTRNFEKPLQQNF